MWMDMANAFDSGCLWKKRIHMLQLLYIARHALRHGALSDLWVYANGFGKCRGLGQ